MLVEAAARPQEAEGTGHASTSRLSALLQDAPGCGSNILAMACWAALACGHAGGDLVDEGQELVGGDLRW